MALVFVDIAMKTTALAVSFASFSFSLLALPGLAAADATAAAAPAPAPPSTVAVAPAPAAAPAADDSRPKLGAELAIMPVGSLGASIGNMSTRVDSATAMGLGATVRFPLNSIFALDLAPRLVFNVKGSDADNSATELDVRARLSAGGEAAPGVRVYAAVAPGYSALFLPDSSGDSSTPTGFILGFAAGTAIKVAPGIAVTGEIGYQLGFQSVSIQNTDVGLDTRFFTLSGGVLFDL
jgi:hypothetical protein